MTSLMRFPDPVIEHEMIVRAALDPYHFNTRKKPHRKYAFHAPWGADSISAMRGSLLTADECKYNAVTHIQDSQRVYKGFWTIQAACIQKVGASVFPTPADYEGHVSIHYGVVRRRHEGLDTPDEVLRYNAVLEGLTDAAQYFEDEDCSAKEWKGLPLTVQCCAEGSLPNTIESATTNE